jgi:hypothetical protein
MHWSLRNQRLHELNMIMIPNGPLEEKRADTLNKNLSQPIPQFSLNATLKTMRAKTGRTSLKDVRKAAAKRQSK